MLADRSTHELPTPLREGFAVMEAGMPVLPPRAADCRHPAAREAAERSEVADVLDELFDDREAGSNSSAMPCAAGAAGAACGEHIVEQVLEAADLFIAAAAGNMGYMISTMMNHCTEQGTEELSSCRVDVLVDATAQSMIVLIKSCKDKVPSVQIHVQLMQAWCRSLQPDCARLSWNGT